MRIPRKYRPAIVAAAEGLVLVLSLAWCRSFGEAPFYAAVPAFLVYLVLVRPKAFRKLSWKHVVYFGFLAVLVGGYLAVFACMATTMRVSWAELPLALYFLASLHILLWLIDRGLTAVFSRVLRPVGRLMKRRTRTAAATILRATAMFLVGGPLVAASLSTHWLKFSESADPGDLCGMPFEEAGFTSADGLQLRGWFIPSSGGTSDMTVIAVPGAGMNRLNLLEHAMVLRESWFNVFLVDLRGQGASEGHVRGFGAAEAQDVTAAVNYLRQTRPSASRHVYALGVGQGAAAVLAAARNDPRIEALVLDSLVPSPATEIDRLTEWIPWPLGRYFRQATLLAASAQLGHNLFEQSAADDLAALSSQPVLMVHGKCDSLVSVQEAEAVYAASRTPTMFWIVAGAGHGQSISQCPEGYSKMATSMFKAVRMKLSPFCWAALKPSAREG